MASKAYKSDGLIAIKEVLVLARRHLTGGYSRKHLDALGSNEEPR